LNVVAPCALRGVSLPGVAANPVQRKNAQAIGKLSVLCGNHAAFAGREGFRRVERETSDVSDFADRSPFEARRKSVSGVFDDRQAVAAANVENGVESRSVTGIMDGDDRARLLRDVLFDLRDIHVIGTGRAINKDGLGAEI